MSNQINLDNYCAFYLENQRQPEHNTPYETSLASWRTRMRFANVFKSLPTVSPLSDEEMARVLAIDSKFFDEEFAPDVKRVNDYCAFYIENQRQPDRHSSNVTERLLGSFRSNMKFADKFGKCSTEHKYILSSVDPAFFLD